MKNEKKEKSTSEKSKKKPKYVAKSAKQKRLVTIVLIKESTVVVREKSGVNSTIKKGDLPKNIIVGDEIKI